MNYEELLAELYRLADQGYRTFQGGLLKNDSLNLIGVRIPQLRALSKRFKGREDELLSFPDEFYEVTFIKLTAVAAMPYDKFSARVERCVDLLDNWATCDSFAAKCISSHKQEFTVYIDKFLSDPREFSQRYAVTTLLHYYVERDWLDYIFSCCARADNSKYYVHMAVAWLIAEVLVKYYSEGISFLSKNILPAATHNKVIQKAKESYRLTPEQKINLNKLKR